MLLTQTTDCVDLLPAEYLAQRVVGIVENYCFGFGVEYLLQLIVV